MKATAAILLAFVFTRIGEAVEQVDEAIYGIYGDHMAGEKIPEKRVHEAMERVVFKDFEVKGDLKAAVAEIKRQHPGLFISFGASDALHANLPKVQISEKKIGLKTLMDKLAKEGRCGWEYTVGKGLLLHFTKTEERDIRVFNGL